MNIDYYSPYKQDFVNSIKYHPSCNQILFTEAHTDKQSLRIRSGFWCVLVFAEIKFCEINFYGFHGFNPWFHHGKSAKVFPREVLLILLSAESIRNFCHVFLVQIVLIPLFDTFNHIYSVSTSPVILQKFGLISICGNFSRLLSQ